MASKIIYLLKILLFLLIMILFTMFMSNNLDFVKVNLAPFDYILEIKCDAGFDTGAMAAIGRKLAG